MRHVAIIHDWLTVYAGAERVLEQLLVMYPQADLFSVCDFISESERSFLKGKRPTTTFIQKLPGSRKHYRAYLPWMPLAIEQLDLSGYELVISSSHAVAKGVITGPDQLHISYIHSPMRYAWDLQHQYLREAGLDSGLKGMLARWFLHKLRIWDTRTSNGVDCFVTNSEFVARRVRKVYGRDSRVIYPPVDVRFFTPASTKDEDTADYYLTASRMVPYKRMDLIVRAFEELPELELRVVGEGPDASKLQGLASRNVKFLGYQTQSGMLQHMRGARAFIFAAEEDFGILPVEAQACAIPVIAFGRGGSLETVRSGVTGVFFDEQTVGSLVEAIKRFERIKGSFDGQRIRKHAEQFSAARFRQEFGDFVGHAWTRFRGGRDAAV